MLGHASPFVVHEAGDHASHGLCPRIRSYSNRSLLPPPPPPAPAHPRGTLRACRWLGDMQNGTVTYILVFHDCGNS